MSSKSIYSKKPYVVYHVTYSGDLLPPKNNSSIAPQNYIGSTSIYRIQNGYMGSVSSGMYASIWKQELKDHPELFHLEIISYHDTRPEASYRELHLQKIFNVVKNPLFVNMAYAKHNFFQDNAGYTSTNPAIKEKKKQTYIRNFGVDSPLKNPIICAKARKTQSENCFSQHGVYCHTQRTSVIEKRIKTYSKNCQEQRWHKLRVSSDLELYIKIIEIADEFDLYTENHINLKAIARDHFTYYGNFNGVYKLLRKCYIKYKNEGIYPLMVT